jgi:hypothetical protein
MNRSKWWPLVLWALFGPGGAHIWTGHLARFMTRSPYLPNILPALQAQGRCSCPCLQGTATQHAIGVSGVAVLHSSQRCNRNVTWHEVKNGLVRRHGTTSGTRCSDLSWCLESATSNFPGASKEMEPWQPWWTFFLAYRCPMFIG